ncbi:peptidyl-tRNA hydrolase [Bacteroidota bacterium]|nr:peptidyl-tRNA hydrolase [Bacteroidota bacterium]
MKYLIAGLGNIGNEYRDTRHNIGFDITDALAKEAGASFFTERFADYALVKHKGRQVHLIKPTTYMNLSGAAVRYWLQKLDIDKSNLLVLVDDLALPFGTIRIRAKGSDGGHNGLKHITEMLTTDQYPRLRFGIGNTFGKGRQIDYVLGKWNDQEQKQLPELIKKSCEATRSFTTVGLERTMNLFNK